MVLSFMKALKTLVGGAYSGEVGPWSCALESYFASIPTSLSLGPGSGEVRDLPRHTLCCCVSLFKPRVSPLKP